MKIFFHHIALFKYFKTNFCAFTQKKKITPINTFIKIIFESTKFILKSIKLFLCTLLIKKKFYGIQIIELCD